MLTKKKELNTLESTLESSIKSEAEKTKEIADDRAMLDDTKDALEADETFFTETKDSCTKKSKVEKKRS